MPTFSRSAVSQHRARVELRLCRRGRRAARCRSPENAVHMPAACISGDTANHGCTFVARTLVVDLVDGVVVGAVHRRPRRCRSAATARLWAGPWCRRCSTIIRSSGDAAMSRSVSPCARASSKLMAPGSCGAELPSSTEISRSARGGRQHVGELRAERPVVDDRARLAGSRAVRRPRAGCSGS